jgi:hypothetical protein
VAGGWFEQQGSPREAIDDASKPWSQGFQRRVLVMQLRGLKMLL